MFFFKNRLWKIFFFITPGILFRNGKYRILFGFSIKYPASRTFGTLNSDSKANPFGSPPSGNSYSFQVSSQSFPGSFARVQVHRQQILAKSSFDWGRGPFAKFLASLNQLKSYSSFHRPIARFAAFFFLCPWMAQTKRGVKWVRPLLRPSENFREKFSHWINFKSYDRSVGFSSRSG